MTNRVAIVALIALLATSSSYGQSVCLPAPRLLTMMPMGGEQGATVEVVISGQHLYQAEELIFSHPGITAKSQVNEKGESVPNRYLVSVAESCPVGIYEARVDTILGMSTSRVFSVSGTPETIVESPNRTVETAKSLAVGSVCNASVSTRSIDYYSFEAKKNEPIHIQCAAQGIESKLTPVLIVADATGADLQVERRGRDIDFTPEADGTYIVKVHDLTYSGGPNYFYRLAIQHRSESSDERVAAHGGAVQQVVQAVNSFSWPPANLPEKSLSIEHEPNNSNKQPEVITLPCDISGSFFPAADVDVFEFTAKKGEVWWVEVASQRLGLNTDPSIVVQRVNKENDVETLVDVAELKDIPSPIKVSSNGYSYDGPPYDAGSTDILGKIEIQQDGVHRLQIRDLFGGTRNDPANIYRLIIRKAQPDFSVVGWALHMNLRNGDRNALSKPLALRAGSTMPLEISVVRRDGFNGEIKLEMEELPIGVTATGLTIPAGAVRGIMLITADESAPRGWNNVGIFAHANINDVKASRRVHFASMQWPVKDASQEIPVTRLLQSVPVSVCSDERAPLTIQAEPKVFEVVAGEQLTIPLTLIRRSEFSGNHINLRTFGNGLSRTPPFDVSLSEDTSQAVIDTAKTKAAPGEYTVAFYGSAVVKYLLSDTVNENSKTDAKPKDTVEIIVSQPIKIRVTPAETK